MIELRPYGVDDLTEQPWRVREAGCAPHEAEMRELRMRGPAWTLWDVDGQPVAAAGIIIFRAGIGEAWLRATPRIEARWVSAARACRMVFAEAVKTWHLARVQAVISSDSAVAVRFARWLGFSLEGRLRNFGLGGEDYLMFAHIPTLDQGESAAVQMERRAERRRGIPRAPDTRENDSRAGRGG